MDKIEKLLKKISKKHREKLLEIIGKLLTGNQKGLNIKKLKNSDFYRLMSERFRIIFHYESKGGDIVVDSIRLRDDNTYKKQ